MIAQNAQLRAQLEESHRTNESLTNDLQKLTNDWESLRDEMLSKEDEWKMEEEVKFLKFYYCTNNNDLYCTNKRFLLPKYFMYLFFLKCYIKRVEVVQDQRELIAELNS